MNYSAVKNYGKMLRKTAEHISSYDDIYKAAVTLPYDTRAYLVMSFSAFFELNLSIDSNKETISKVIKKYVLFPEIEQYILNNPNLDRSKEFDFIEKECGDFFSLMQNILIDIGALTIISHRDEYGEKDVTWAKEQIADRIKPTPENQAAFTFSVNTLFPKEQPNAQTDIQPKKQQPKYTIGNEHLLLDIVNYLRSTGVLDRDFQYHELAIAVENADISKIQPLIKDKFWSSLSHIKRCVKSQKKEWLRDACASINIVPKQASKNNTNLKEWYEMLCDIVEKGLKK